MGALTGMRTQPHFMLTSIVNTVAQQLVSS